MQCFYIYLHRRLLQMGVYNVELFNNLGLCCFYAQQYDHVISCFERALNLSTDENIADIWYNISHIALVCIQILVVTISCNYRNFPERSF